MLETLVSPIVQIHYAYTKKREKEMGYSLTFHNLAPHWINGLMIFDMSHVWKKFGLNAIGVNYFTIGAVKNGLSTRFDAKSPYYQAWLGGYIVRFAKPHAWTLEDHFKLGVSDQKNWLKLYGDQNPFVEVDLSSLKNRGKITIGEYEGALYEGNIWSDTDIGKGKSFLPLPLLMSGGAHHFNKDNPHLNVNYQNFIPKWKQNAEPLAPYQKILLKGYIGLIPLNATTKVMLYANGCEFTDKRGEKYDHFKTIKEELRALLEKVEIRKL